MKRIVKYFHESRSELSKVVWPEKKETVRLTAIVIAVTFAIGAYLGELDYLFNKLLGFLIK